MHVDINFKATPPAPIDGARGSAGASTGGGVQVIDCLYGGGSGGPEGVRVSDHRIGGSEQREQRVVHGCVRNQVISTALFGFAQTDGSGGTDNGGTGNGGSDPDPVRPDPIRLAGRAARSKKGPLGPLGLVGMIPIVLSVVVSKAALCSACGSGGVVATGATPRPPIQHARVPEHWQYAV